MMKRFARPLLILLGAAALAAGVATAQDGEERSRFVQLIEGMVSTPDRQVAIVGLDGAFTSNPTAERITVSDREGVWLQIEAVDVVWNRTALFRRTLDIDSLSAGEMTMLRRPVPPAEEAEPQSEETDGGGLPVDMTVDAFSLPQVTLAAPVAGAEARLSAQGSAEVTDEAIAAELNLERQDRPGTLAADLRLVPDGNVLTADLRLAEPERGLLADLLGLRGRPAVAIALDGEGPLDDFQAELEMQAGGARVLAGSLAVSRVEAGYRIAGDLAASLESVAPAQYSALLAGDSRLSFAVVRQADGDVAIESAALQSEGVELAASGALAADLTPQNVDLSLRLGEAGRAQLPFVPGEVSVASLEAAIGLDASDAAPWTAAIEAQGIESAFGAVQSLSVDASGQASNLAAPGERSATFSLEGSAEGVQPGDPALAEALGPTLRLTAGGAWSPGEPVELETLQAVLTGATASFSGTVTAEALEGRFGASVTDLARFAELARREIGGSAQLQATGRVMIANADVDLTLDGEATDLRVGVAALDPLLAGTTTVSGGLARAGGEIRFDRLSLANQAVTAEVTGALGAPELDLTVNATLADLSSLTARAEGRAELSARIAGTTAAPLVEAEVRGAELMLMGRPLTDALARFSGVVAGPETQGEAELSGSLGGVPVEGSARLSAATGGGRALDELLLRVGESRGSGDLVLGADGLISGEVSVASPDLSQVAPLFLVEAEGHLNAEVALSAEGGRQSASFSADAADLVYGTVTVGSAEIDGEALDIFAAPQVEGSFSVSNLAAGGLTIVTATGTAEQQGQRTGFTVDATLADGSAGVRGSLEPSGGGLAVSLESFGFSRDSVDLALAAPTTIAVADGTARFDVVTVNIEGGSATIDGSAGETLDVTVTLAAVPAAVANNVVPDLGAEGIISGTANVTGTAAAPTARFDARWEGAALAASRNAGLGPLSVTAEGAFADGNLDLTSEISAADGFSVSVAGSVGTAAGAPLDLAVTGTVPLSLGNRQLAARGAALEGALSLDIAISGAAADPQFRGRVTSEGGGFVDPETGIVLRDLSLAASLSGDQVVVERLTAESGEGTVSASGSIGIAPAAGFPVDIAVEVRQARYVDGTLLTTRFDADLTLTGSFSDGPVVGGRVFLDRTEITVPEQLPRDSVAVDVEHVNTPPDVARTLERAATPGRRDGAADGGEPAGIALDVTIAAPRQIFVRGRGLDAEVGGELRLTGSVSAIVADGAFEMRRGRLDIFTQRITFDRGVVTFAGDLDPILDFSGSTQSEDITVTVTVTGQASDPEVTFSSVPELPQDEVLAHLLFNRGIGELSPVQIARLAAAATQLAGGSGGGGLLDSLRRSTGLDDLDIVTDAEGAPALAAGRYVNENVYLGVQQGATGESTRVTIDLDVTKDVKVRAGVSPQGESSLGIFFEREY